SLSFRLVPSAARNTCGSVKAPATPTPRNSRRDRRRYSLQPDIGLSPLIRSVIYQKLPMIEQRPEQVFRLLATVFTFFQILHRLGSLVVARPAGQGPEIEFFHEAAIVSVVSKELVEAAAGLGDLVQEAGVVEEIERLWQGRLSAALAVAVLLALRPAEN